VGETFADHTTLRLGGPAAWITHTTPAHWPDLVHSVEGQPFVLGGGSNTIAPDHGYRGTVVRMATRGITARGLGDDRVDVTAHAGETLAGLVAHTVADGLTGIEYLGGIPGTVGAAPVQNTGAYGQQIADRLVHVTAWDWRHGRQVRLDATACRFRYRSSVFKRAPGRWTILTVTLRLHRSPLAAPVTYEYLARALGTDVGARPPLTEAAAAVLADRQARGLSLPDDGPDARQAGSSFVNPPVTKTQAQQLRAAGGRVYRDCDGVLRASAGWLLERSGYRPGQQLAAGVYCSTSRTLTVTARQGATAATFLKALDVMARTVHDVSAIKLQPEPAQPACAGTANCPRPAGGGRGRHARQ
jgi:UDP-N-acetylmuramate dehydrogenase